MSENILNVRIQEKYDTEANWNSKNPILLKGEIAFSSDKNNIYKVGDGLTAWKNLSYAPSGTVTSVAISNGGGLSVSGSPITSSGTITISHADTSSQASVNNSGRTYIQDITLDTYGHVTGITSATETVVNTDRYVNSAAFADATSADVNNPVKMTLTRAGSDTASVTAYIPKVSSSSAGVVPKGAAVSSQSKTTKFLREDGTWAVPSYTTNTNTTYTISASGESVVLTGSDSSTSTADLSTAFTNYTPYKGNLTSIIGSASPASAIKTYWENNDNIKPTSVNTAYNTAGQEYAFLLSKGGSNQYGAVIRWGYGTKYFEMLRKYGSTWKDDDWVKMDAGYADTAGSATKDGSGNTITSTYLPLAGGTVTGQTTFNTSIHDAGGQTIFAGGATASTWYKITLATNGVTPPSSQQWYMCSMTIHTGGSYGSATKSTIELSYYIYWTGSAFQAMNVYAMGVGNNLQNVILYYKLTDPFVIYVRVQNSYTSVWVDKVSYRDSSMSYRTNETKVETTTEITVSDYSTIPIAKIYTTNGNDLYFNNHIYPSSNNAYDLGSSNNKWSNIYTTNISSTNATFTGKVNFANQTWNYVGDDVAIGDINVSGTLGIKGLNGATGIQFQPYSGSTSQKISIDGAGTMTITGGVSARVSELGNYFNITAAGMGNRQTSANINSNNNGGLRTFLATSSMTTGKPSGGDGHIIHLDWDNSGLWASQISIANSTGLIEHRGQTAADTWTQWYKVYSEYNKPTKSDIGLGNVENKSSATIRGELTSSNVTTALGFTPYNSTNPNGYTSNIGTVTGVKVNGTTKSPSSGIVDIGTLATSDTKNTAGSTDTSSKIYLVGATSQAANPQTYSDNEVFTTSGVLTTKSIQVGGGSATMEYSATTKSINFVFAS